MKINKKIFLQNLSSTQSYCEERIKNKSESTTQILRSLNLNYNQKSIFEFEWNSKFNLELVKWNFEILDNDLNIVKELFHQQINLKHSYESNRQIFKGKILVSEFESTVTDGTSEIESKGLIDIYDLPPIDTWFYLTKVNGVLNVFAWIPEKFQEEANNAIEVNCLDILFWLKNLDNSITW